MGTMFKKNVVFIAAILMGSILLGSIAILTDNSRVYGQTQNKTEEPEQQQDPEEPFHLCRHQEKKLSTCSQ